MIFNLIHNLTYWAFPHRYFLIFLFQNLLCQRRFWAIFIRELKLTLIFNIFEDVLVLFTGRSEWLLPIQFYLWRTGVWIMGHVHIIFWLSCGSKVLFHAKSLHEGRQLLHNLLISLLINTMALIVIFVLKLTPLALNLMKHAEKVAMTAFKQVNSLFLPLAFKISQNLKRRLRFYWIWLNLTFLLILVLLLTTIFIRRRLTNLLRHSIFELLHEVVELICFIIQLV